MARVTPIFILESIQKVFSNDKDILGNELNLDFSSKVSPEKQAIFAVETPPKLPRNKRNTYST